MANGIVYVALLQLFIIVFLLCVCVSLFIKLDRAKTDAYRNSVSKLPNMLGIESRVRGAFAQMQRGKIKKITVVAIDLDNFKRVNDTYGHKSGDKVLAVAGEILLHSTRLEDIVAHLSGDEFLILFCDTEDSHVEEILLRAKKKLSTRYFSFANGKILTNFTYGCASSASDKETFESLYHSADMDCNRRKRSVGGSRFKSLLA